jgi:hypothetical protein
LQSSSLSPSFIQVNLAVPEFRGSFFLPIKMSHQLLRFIAAVGLLALPLSIVAGPTESLEVVARRDSILARRDVQQPYSGGKPSCDEKDDPSYAQGKSRFQDGEGKYIGSGCDASKGSSRKCWQVFNSPYFRTRHHLPIAVASPASHSFAPWHTSFSDPSSCRPKTN